MTPRVFVWLALFLAIGLLGRPAVAQPAKDSFPQFCEEWMQKLAERERRNRSQIAWQEEQGEVRGTYVGYSNQHQCVYKESSDATPVGKITYLEVRYEKRGATREEAERNPPRAIETTEVTEIFRYAKGKWVY
ncbi:MAG: hypothetical protein N3C12_03050 [Candidatus Binatia bacterium]|nr:hypothetical protein [Candidatus Binatia bacterium]